MVTHTPKTSMGPLTLPCTMEVSPQTLDITGYILQTPVRALTSPLGTMEGVPPTFSPLDQHVAVFLPLHLLNREPSLTLQRPTPPLMATLPLTVLQRPFPAVVEPTGTVRTFLLLSQAYFSSASSASTQPKTEPIGHYGCHSTHSTTLGFPLLLQPTPSKLSTINCYYMAATLNYANLYLVCQW